MPPLSHRKPRSLARSALACLACLLPGCRAAVPPGPTATPPPPAVFVTELASPAPPNPSPPANSPPGVEPSPEPPTPPPRRVGLIASGAEAGDSSPARLVWESLQFLRSEYGWTVETGGPSDLEKLISEGAQIIVTVGSGLPLEAAAQQHLDLQFVAVDEVGAQSLPNLLVVGGEATRHDQAAFMTGVAAGLASEYLGVAVLADSGTPLGRNTLNGFVHGVRYSCPECAITSEELPEATLHEEARAAARRAFNRGIFDVVFAQPGPAGEAALGWMAEHEHWVIGLGYDLHLRWLEAGQSADAGRAFTSVLFRPDRILLAALPLLARDETVEGPIPYTVAEGRISLAPDWAGLLTPADQAFLDRTIQLLSSGVLDTGVDPATGEER